MFVPALLTFLTMLAIISTAIVLILRTRTVEHVRMPDQFIVYVPPEPPEELKGYILEQRDASFWNTYYPVIGDYVEKWHFETGLFVEIGTGWGGLPIYLMKRFREIHVVAIDPFIPSYDQGDIQAEALAKIGAKYPDISSLFARIYRLDAAKFGLRYRLIHNTSSNAVFANASIDCLFVDGLHTAEGVAADIKRFVPFLKPNAPIIFNDYPLFTGVVQAVNDFANATNQFVVRLDSNNVVLRNV